MVFPPEWDLHKATWLAWPDLAEEWCENHEGARAEFLALCRVIGMPGSSPQEKLKILIRSEEERRRVELELKEFNPSFYHFDYGDIWLRDTACVFSKNDEKQNVAQVFRFNGWGGKYLLRKDAELAEELAKRAGIEMVRHSFVLEGGAIDHNGNGVWVTTEDCLLNPNRNTRMNKADYENHFKKLGAKKVCWIKEGLLNDHTDGHVDNILRFVNEDTLLCMTSAGKFDPQGERIEEIHEQAKEICSELGFNLVTIKGPGEVKSSEGDFMPASYMNFYIANNSVAVPLYGSPQDEAAVKIIQSLFPTRKVVGLSSRSILTGGGSFHCITQQEPQ